MLDCDCGQLTLDAANGLDSDGLSLATAETALGLVSSEAPQSPALGGVAPLQLSPAPTLLLSAESAVQAEGALDAETQSVPNAIAQTDNLTGLAETTSSLVGALPGLPGIGCIVRIPDLTIAPDAELQSNPDGTVTVSWAVTNLSGSNSCADVAANSFFNRFWLSSDEVLDVTSDTPIAADSAPPGTTIDDDYYRNQVAIAVDETSAVREETFSISSDEPYLILSVNQPQGIGETDFTNNVVVFDLQALGNTQIEATPVDNTGYNQDTNCAPEHDVSVNSNVETHSGALTETHTLAAYQSQGMDRALTLHYDSTTADVQPIVHFAYENVEDAPGAQLLIARLSLQVGDAMIAVPGYTGDQFGLSGGEHFWTVPDQDNAVVQGALQADLSDQASGVYTYQVERDIQTFDAAATFDPLRHTTTGTVTVVNRTDSPFGHGWSLAGWQEIVVNDDESVLLLNGDGTHQIFQPPTEAGGAYVSQSGDYSRLERLADGTFQRTLRDQTVTTFNAQNQLTTVTDRNGNTLTYGYDAVGQLATMRDAVGLETTFTYTEGRITTITDPAGRETVLAYDAAGNLQSITDPDAAVRTWEYDDQSRMTAEIDQRGNRETTEYDAFGRVDRSIRRDGSVIDINPVQVQGLTLPSQTIDPTTAPVALTPTAADLATPTATHTDGRGNATVFTLNQAGNLLTQTDAVGNVVEFERDCSCGEVSAIVDGTGDRTTITYDEQGNPSLIVDSISGAAGLQQVFDPQFNQLIQVTDELGRQTLHELDASGNIEEIRQVVGEVGGADDRVTTMTYLSDGLVDTVTDPLGRVTDFDYDAQGQVTTITYAQGTADEAIERYEYDSAGNQSAFIDARNNRTTFEYDGRNRLMAMVEADPDGEGPLTTTTTQKYYEEAGQQQRREEGRAQETQLRLNRLAFFDPLTGLANRECFRRRVEAFLQNSKPGNEAALLLIDLDGFKSVNAAMGHDVGDDILGQVGARLRELFVDDTLSPERTILTNYRSDPTVVRLGGDVFCVFLPHCGTSAAVSLAERVRRRLSIPFPRESGALRLGASIGVATVPNDALEYFGLILAAENAMFRAKRSGKNRVCLSGASPLDFSCQASVVSHPHDFATDHTVQFEPFFRAVDMSFAGVNAVITCLSDAGADRPTEGWFETLADVGLLRQVHYEAFDQAIEAMTELTHGGLSPLHLSVRVPVDLMLDDVFMVCVLDLLPLPFELSFAVFTPLGHPVSLADTAWAIAR